MATLNKKTDKRFDSEVRLAGGGGQLAAIQTPEQHLRRCVMACLLWEDLAYASGSSVAKEIEALVPQVDPHTVESIAREAKFEQKLRHVPLFIACEMTKHPQHKLLVRELIRDLIVRPDELCETLAIYWRDGKRSICNRLKRGIADAFHKFDEYQLAKWDRARDIRIRDVLFLTHPKPETKAQEELWKRLVDGNLATPNTWEVGLSAAKGDEEKRKAWEGLIAEGKLGATALLKNLRNIQQVGVPREMINSAILAANPSKLLPLNFLAARKHAPDFTFAIENLMGRCAASWPKLKGWTIFVVDVSGSMHAQVSAKSQFTRQDCAAAMAVLAAEMCEDITVYVTAGEYHSHCTKKLAPCRGFALADLIMQDNGVGYGGIFTRQCIDYIRKQESGTPDRIIVFSDSQDCDHLNKTPPKTFGKYNYIADVSSHKHGVGYNRVWTAEISGWSEKFLQYIADLEAMDNGNT